MHCTYMMLSSSNYFKQLSIKCTLYCFIACSRRPQRPDTNNSVSSPLDRRRTRCLSFVSISLGKWMLESCGGTTAGGRVRWQGSCHLLSGHQAPTPDRRSLDTCHRGRGFGEDVCTRVCVWCVYEVKSLPLNLILNKQTHIDVGDRVWLTLYVWTAERWLKMYMIRFACMNFWL